jgi:phasin family protein
MSKNSKASAAKAPVAAKAAAPKAAQPAAEKTMAAPTAIAAATVATETQPVVTPAEPTTKGPTMTDTVNNTAKTFAEDAQARATQFFGDVNARTKAAVERSTKLAEEMNEFNKGNIEALVESGRVAAKAAETLGQQAAEAARKNFEQTTAALKSFASAKTPTEFFQLQSDFARTAFDQMIAETSKNSETLLKVAGDVFQPLSNRFAVAADKFKAAA